MKEKKKEMIFILSSIRAGGTMYNRRSGVWGKEQRWQAGGYNSVGCVGWAAGRTR